MNVRLVIGAAVMAASFYAGWQINTWRYDSLLLEQQQAIAAARARADDAERRAAETRATVIEKEKVVTNEVIKYVQRTDRVVCEYDAEWLRVRSEILRTADPRSVPVDRTMPVE